MPSRRPRRREERPRRPRLDHFRADGSAKTRFGSEEEAERAAFQARLDHGTELGSYRCDMCGGWHLGSRDGEVW